MESNFSSVKGTIVTDVRTEWLVASMEKLIHIAEKRELEIIYQFSKELLSKFI